MPYFTNVQNRKYTYREGRETDVIHNEHFELAVITVKHFAIAFIVGSIQKKTINRR